MMLPKPETCNGCPFYGDGIGFVPDEVPENAEAFFILQGPGDVEECQGRPAVGPVGSLFRLQLVGEYLAGRRVGFGNLFKCRPRHGDLLPAIGSEEWEAAAAHCAKAYLVPNLMKISDGALRVFVGAHAIGWAFHEYRGEEMLHVRGTFRNHNDHPAYLMEHPGVLSRKRTPQLRWVFRQDLQRIVKLVMGWRPDRRTDAMEFLETASDVVTWFDGVTWTAFDLETSRRTADPTAVDTIGLASYERGAAVFHASRKDLVDAFTGGLHVRKLIVHYGEGLEVPWLLHQGVPVGLPGGPTVHDLHKLHFASDPEADHSLAFVQSIYTWRPYHKHELTAADSWQAKARYCMKDCLAQYDAFMALRAQGVS